jgi:expansin (peptidoglycan-binding protein)
MNAVSLYVLCGMLAVLAGCTSYYRVNDPAGTREYYTTDIDKSTVGGAITFKDEKSGSVVTLQSSEIKEISEEEFNAGVKSGEKGK